MLDSRLPGYVLLGLWFCTGLPELDARPPAAAQIKTLRELSGSLESLARGVGQATVLIFAVRYTPSTLQTGVTGGLLIEQRSTGSGSLLSSDGYIITNSHIVSNARIVHVVLPTPLEEKESPGSILKPVRKRVVAEIIGTDQETDLARIDHRFGNEGDFGRPERFSESFAIDPVQVE